MKKKKTKTSISGADLMNLVADSISIEGVSVDYNDDGEIVVVDKKGRKKIEFKFELELE